MSGPRLTVALVSDAVEFGGCEVYLITLAEALREEIELCALVGDRAPDEFSRRLIAAGVRVEVVDGLGRRPRPGALRSAAALLRRLRPDAVHVNASDQGGGSVGIAAARLARLPVIVTVHLIVPLDSPWRRWLSRFTLERAGAIVAVSDTVARPLRRRGRHVVVVPNGLPAPSLAADARASLGLEPSAFVVGGIGRLDQQKGWDVLCRAAGMVRERVPGATFVVIGDGPERHALEASPGCEGVHFAGYREGAASLLGAFDVLAIPSRYEGMPLVCIEAMHAGVPVVATSVGGLSAMVGDAGLLVEPDRPDELAQALMRVAEDGELRSRLADAGRARARERFDPARMARATLELYEVAAAGAP